MIYHIDSISFFKRDYHKEGNEWSLNFKERDDTTNIYTKRIIYPNKVVEFSYTDTILNNLYDVGVLIKDTMSYFRPKAVNNRKLSISDIPSIELKTPYTVRFWFDTIERKVKIFKEFGQIEKGSKIPIISLLSF